MVRWDLKNVQKQEHSAKPKTRLQRETLKFEYIKFRSGNEFNLDRYMVL